MIVDAQVYIWGADTPERPWPASGRRYAHRDTPLGKDALLREMDAAGVDRVAIVPPSWEGDRNDLALQAAVAHPDRFAVMGRLYPYPNIHGYLAQVFGAFGALRMFWGTDLTRLPFTYRQAVTMFTEELNFLSDSDKKWIMGRALCAWLGWP